MTEGSIEALRPANHQVFQPVPTNEDMRMLRNEVSRIRAGRARLAVTAIFLLGVVIAGVVGLVFIDGSYSRQIQTIEDRAATLQDEVDARDETIASLETKLQESQALLYGYTDFQSIRSLQVQAQALEDEIAELLSQPARHNAPPSLTSIPPPVEWRDDVISALVKRRDELNVLKQKILAWPPPAASPRPD